MLQHKVCMGQREEFTTFSLGLAYYLKILFMRKQKDATQRQEKKRNRK
jgi:hypothetical protein